MAKLNVLVILVLLGCLAIAAGATNDTLSASQLPDNSTEINTTETTEPMPIPTEEPLSDNETVPDPEEDAPPTPEPSLEPTPLPTDTSSQTPDEAPAGDDPASNETVIAEPIAVEDETAVNGTEEFVEDNVTASGDVVGYYKPSYGGDLFFGDAPWRIEPDVNDILIIAGYAGNLDAAEESITLDNIHIIDNNNGGQIVTSAVGEYSPPIEPLDPMEPYLYEFFVDKNTLIPDLSTGNFSISVQFDMDESENPPYTDYTTDPIYIHPAIDSLPAISDWYTGDSHQHTFYSNNFLEFGAPVWVTQIGNEQLGLEWSIATDHSFDLDATSWEEQGIDCAQSSASTYRYIQGEEVSVQLPGLEPWFNHLLVYNAPFIATPEEFDPFGHLHPADVIDRNLYPEAIFYPAHPMAADGVSPDPIRDVWQDYTLDFHGLQIWNYANHVGDPQQLIDGLNKWINLMIFEDQKIWISGGTDAHGDFNRLAGKVKTVIYAPGYQVDNLPPEEDILEALRNGNSIMTDGPLVVFTITNELGDTAIIGDTIAGEDFYLDVEWKSTPEFGEIDVINVYHGIIGVGEVGPIYTLTPGDLGGTDQIYLNDRFLMSLDSYIRLEATSTDVLGNEHHAYTNPIFLEFESGPTNADVALVIDSSASMGWNDPNNVRLDAAVEFVHLADSDDQIAVISFDTYGYVEQPLRRVGDYEQTLINSINQIGSDGSSTNIADGLYTAYDELIAPAADPDFPKAVILLSDGVSTAPSLTLYQQKGWPVYTIGLTGTGSAILQDIAEGTGGKFYETYSPTALQEIYSDISRTIRELDTVASESGMIAQGETIYRTIPIDASTDYVEAQTSWPGSDLDLFLYYPNGTQVALDPSSPTGTTDPNIHFTSAATYEIYKMYNPVHGEWLLAIHAVDVPGLEPFAYVVSVSSPIVLNATLDQPEYMTGDQVLVSAQFTNGLSGLEGANVTAEMIAPSGATESFPLSELGMGEYQGRSYSVYENGTWEMVVKANDGRIFREYSIDFTVDQTEYWPFTIESDKGAVIRGSPFVITVTGRPNQEYLFYIREDLGSWGPEIVPGQPGVNTTPEATAWFNDFSYLWDVPMSDGTKAVITTGADGKITIVWNTTLITDDFIYSFKVFDPASSESKVTEVMVSKPTSGVEVFIEDPAYYLGEEVRVSGVNPAGNTTYLFMTGLGLDENGTTLSDPTLKANEGYFTEIQTNPDGSWNYYWDTSILTGALSTDQGIYKVFASTDPVDLAAIQGHDFGWSATIIRKPYTDGTAITMTQPAVAYLGEEILLSGVNTVSDVTYLFMTGPNLAYNGVSLYDPSLWVVSMEGYTFTTVAVMEDGTWEFDWDTAGLPLAPATYTIYAVPEPWGVDGLDWIEYASGSLYLKDPFIAGTMASDTIAAGDIMQSGGIITGDPWGYYAWILGDNYVYTSAWQARNGCTYQFWMYTPRSPGEYNAIFQHPMNNGMQDVYLDGSDVYNKISGEKLFILTGMGSLQGSAALEALVEALSSPYIDDTYILQNFTLVDPWISIDIPQEICLSELGSALTINGTTNIESGNEFWVRLTNPSGAEISQNITVTSTDGVHSWSAAFNTSQLEGLGTYTVQILPLNFYIESLATFTIVDAGTPCIDVEIYVNGDDADTAPGPYLSDSGAISWTGYVANCGNVDFDTLSFYDNYNGSSIDFAAFVGSPIPSSLAVGDSYYFNFTTDWHAGQNENILTVIGYNSTYGCWDSVNETTYYYGDESISNDVSIHGYIFEDLDADGVMDAGEPRISGMEVLINGTIVLLSDITDTSGYYSFENLSPGLHLVQEIEPAGIISTTPNLVWLDAVAGNEYSVNFGDIISNTSGTGEAWTVPMWITSGNYNQNLNLGTIEGAIQLYDEYDLVRPPIFNEVNYAYFHINDSFFNLLLDDYRPIMNQNSWSESWDLRVEADDSMDIEWNASCVPDTIVTLNMEVDTPTPAVIDMKDTSSHSLAAGSYSITITANYDISPPQISNLAPVDDSTIYALTIPSDITISADYSDNAAIDLDAISLIVDGVDVTSSAAFNSSMIDYTLVADEGTHTVMLEVGDTAGNVAYQSWSFDVSRYSTVDIPLKQGWNMISLPVSDATFTVPPSVLSFAYQYNPATQNYAMIPDITTLEPGKGYWVATTADCTLSVTGIPLTEYDAMVKQGWNMVGSLIADASFTHPETVPADSVMAFAYSYNPLIQNYAYEQTLRTGYGYWVAALQDCSLHVSLGVEDPSPSPTPTPSP